MAVQETVRKGRSNKAFKRTKKVVRWVGICAVPVGALVKTAIDVYEFMGR
ncbi:hypothetical protein QMK19_35555 [Streptomyces sp. H10-C2]|nr:MULTISPECIES: hypothetical protein [unclassified Streptomyces]MDJ0347435.1 hypothetical protein [Streptomyces sp. PH10-H1]MDJ0374800.1 hypothetical protein [Streptomyces sp. H10-C2]